MNNDRIKRFAVLGAVLASTVAAVIVGRLLVSAITPVVWTVTQFASTQGNQIMV